MSLKNYVSKHNWTINELIQTYILIPKIFSKFKKNGDNEKYINWFQNYLLKIPIIQ